MVDFERCGVVVAARLVMKATSSAFCGLCWEAGSVSLRRFFGHFGGAWGWRGVSLRRFSAICGRFEAVLNRGHRFSAVSVMRGA
jgi:hypothetical protein